MTDRVVQDEPEDAAWGAQSRFVADVSDSSDDEDCQTGITWESFPGSIRQEHLPGQNCRQAKKKEKEGGYSGWRISAEEMRVSREMVSFARRTVIADLNRR